MKGLRIFLAVIFLIVFVSTILASGAYFTFATDTGNNTDNNADINANTDTNNNTKNNTNTNTDTYSNETQTATPIERTPRQEKKVEGYFIRTDAEWDRNVRDVDDPGNQTVTVTNRTVTSNGTENKTIYLINKYRSENGLDNWTYSYALASTSRAHSKDMYERDFFSHANPDGELPWDRWGEEECRRKYGENLYRTYMNVNVRDSNGNINNHTTETDIAKHTLYSWQNSTEHNELLLTNNSSIAGVGVYIDSYNAESDSYVVHVTLNTCEPDS